MENPVNQGETKFKILLNTYHFWRVTVFVSLAFMLLIGSSLFALRKETLNRRELENRNEKLQATIEKLANPSPTPRPLYEVEKFERIDECSDKSCLFRSREAVEGLGEITGYYQTYEKMDWGETKVVCDAFVVNEGTEALVSDLKNTVERGNTVNRILDKNKLLLNIKIPDKFRSLIKNSSFNRELTLKIIRRSPRGMGASACTSFVEILDVEEK